MKRIFNLNKYYEMSKYSLIYYDKLVNDKIKDLNITKNEILQDFNISTTSFNRCKKNECKIGKSISNKLQLFFNVTPITMINKEELEKVLEEIYLKFYYKKDIMNYETKIDEYISINTILNPILYLFKFFIKASNYKNPNQIYMENYNLYSMIHNHSDFFVNEFKELLILLEILFSDTIKSYNVSVENSRIKPVLYQALANCAYRNDDYALVIYYGEKAKIEFQKTLNLDRIASLNLMLFLAYNVIGEFDVTYRIAFDQCNYYLLNDFSNRRAKGTIIHFCISCLGLQKYDEAIEWINKLDKSKIGMGEYLILLVAYYLTESDKYYYLLNNIILSRVEYYEMAILLDDYFNKKNRVSIFDLKQNGFNKGLLSVIEKKK